jgi:hypothetical protein
LPGFRDDIGEMEIYDAYKNFVSFATTLVKWKVNVLADETEVVGAFRDDIGEMERKFLLLNYRVADLFRDDMGKMERGSGFGKASCNTRFATTRVK